MRATIALLIALSPARPAGAHITFQATLDATQEVPPVGVPSTGTGSATVTLDDETGIAEYSISYQNLTGTPVFAHFHPGVPGTFGPPLGCCNLDVTSATGPSGTLAGMTGQLTPENIDALIDGGLYINLHTLDNLAGEIRGQLLLAPGKCSCTALTRKEFKKCVKDEVQQLGAERTEEEIKQLKKFVKKSACGRTKGPKKAVACCLPRIVEENIVTDVLCAPVPSKACTKLGGTANVAATSCFPANPCEP